MWLPGIAEAGKHRCGAEGPELGLVRGMGSQTFIPVTFGYRTWRLVGYRGAAGKGSTPDLAVEV